jgi:phage gp37-like protein
MQRIDTSRRRRPAGDGPVRGHRQRAALESIGTPSAPRITTLAPAFGQALPTLGTVPGEYNHEVNAELLYDLCAALVKEGLGSPETWQRCGGNAVAFAQHSIMSGIRAQPVTCCSATSNSIIR